MLDERPDFGKIAPDCQIQKGSPNPTANGCLLVFLTNGLTDQNKSLRPFDIKTVQLTGHFHFQLD